MKHANIYRTKNQFIFCSNSKTLDGLNIFSPPYRHVDLNASDEEYLNALFEVLNSNHLEVPHPKQDEWADLLKMHLKMLNFSSISKMYKNANYCSVSMDESKLTFSPTINKGSRGGYLFESSMDKSIDIASQPKEIVSLLKSILNK